MQLAILPMNSSSPFTAAERLESIKAAILSGGIAGIVAGMILGSQRIYSLGVSTALASLTHGLGGLALGVGVAIAGLSGGLFGLTYRYAIRQDTNPQLKSGVVLAFGLVRGLAQVDVASALAQQAWPFATATIESLLIFATTGLCLDLALQKGWINPFKS